MTKNKKAIGIMAILAVLVIGYTVLNSLLYNGMKPQVIKNSSFQGNYYTKETTTNQTAVLLLGGNQWGDYWAQEFAKKDMVGLSLPYIGLEGLPKLPEDIDLAYFQKALEWLKKQPETHPDKIVVMGASRNAELALVLAAQFPDLIHGAIAYAPSSVSWSNTVLPYNSNQLKPSWNDNGVAIPYIAMERIKANDTDQVDMLAYWNSGLSNTEAVQHASIPVEKINGPILLFSGKDDQVWPAATMATRIEKRLQENNFSHSIQNIQYDHAGHMISGNPDVLSGIETPTIHIDGRNYTYQYGGTPEGDFAAKQDAKKKLMEFLNAL